MIRFILGMLILMGAVGQDDYAMEAGITAPPLDWGLCFGHYQSLLINLRTFDGILHSR
jgi:hypothetical protein